MQILIVCPACEARLNLRSEMLGKQTRCPFCEEVFLVQPPATGKKAPKTRGPAAPADTQAGHVEDLIPMLEMVPEETEEFDQVVSDEAIQSERFISLPIPDSAEYSQPPTAPSIILPPVTHPSIDVPPPPKTKPKPADTPALPATEMSLEIPDLIPLDSDPAPKPVPKSKPLARRESPSEAPPRPKSKSRRPAKSPPPVAPKPSSGPKEVSWSADVPPPPPKELSWSSEVDLPPLPPEKGTSSARNPQKPPAPAATPNKDRLPTYLSDRKNDFDQPKKRGRVAILVGLLIFLVVVLGVGGYTLKNYLEAAPERLISRAEKEYRENHNEPARKLYEEFAREYPTHPRADEARFFVELCALRQVVFSAVIRSNPQGGIDQWSKFGETLRDNPGLAVFADKEHFAVDLWDTLKKLTEETVAHGNDVFDQENPDTVEPWLTAAQKLAPELPTYRPAETAPEGVLEDIDKLAARIANARVRLKVLLEVRVLLTEPDDLKLDTVADLVRVNRLEKDAEILRMVSEAEKKIADRAVYRRFDPPQASSAAPSDPSAGLLFAPLVGKSPEAGVGGLPGVFFAQARGILYALDEADGRIRWSASVGIDTDVLPLRIPATDRNPEMVLVATNDGVHSSLTARVPISGAILWYQPLETPLRGQPILVGQRVFVPLRDPYLPAGKRLRYDQSGVIVEIEINSGAILGKLALGRPSGSGGVFRAGVGHLYLPSETRGIYIFDVDKQNADGSRVDPVSVGFLNTEHAVGTLRTAPVLINPEGSPETPKFLLLSRTDGLNDMVLQAYPLDTAAGVSTAPVTRRLPGWNWYSPYCDSEKLAVVTDRGEIGLFGINQVRNRDDAIFPLAPAMSQVTGSAGPMRGQVVHMEEDTFWILARGQLHRLRLGFNSANGQMIVPDKSPLPLGEPIHAPQTSSRRDAVMVATEMGDSASIRATAIDLKTGQIRWQRILGYLPAGNPVMIGETLYLPDVSGAIWKIPTAFALPPSGTPAISAEDLNIAAPLEDLAEAPRYAVSEDGRALTVCCVKRGEPKQLILRELFDGQIRNSREIPISAPLAGNPLLLGEDLILPLTNGSLVRVPRGLFWWEVRFALPLVINPSAVKLPKGARAEEEGPGWRIEGGSTSAVCHLLPLGKDRFLATDGENSLRAFSWPSGETFEPGRSYRIPGKVGGVPIVLPNGDKPPLLAMTDLKGNVLLIQSEDLTTSVRFWGAKDLGLTDSSSKDRRLVALKDARGRNLLGYVSDGNRLLVLSPDAVKPLWNYTLPGDRRIFGVLRVAGQELLLTDDRGGIVRLDSATGEKVGELPSANNPPSAEVISLTTGTLLLPQADGSVRILREGK